MRALIVEDEQLLREDLEQELLDEQFNIDISASFGAAKDSIIGVEYDLILLDLSLPDGDGLELLEMTRKFYDTAVIIITARGEIGDKVKGLELGSDDYLPKPFSMAELKARIHAVLRRKYKLKENKISVGDLVLQLESVNVHYAGSTISVTETEYKILRYLMLNKGKTVTRIALAEHIWGSKVDDRFSLDFINSHMKNIRKKLQQHGIPGIIETIYGVGYKMIVDET